MGAGDAMVGPLADLLDAVVADPAARDAAKLKLLAVHAGGGLAAVEEQLAAAFADRWTSRARPSFLYVMYALLLWSIPIGVLEAVRPGAAEAIAAGMTAYFAGIPQALYTLFGTGYLGYTIARQWGKAQGTDK
jgi:hypothetical protein